MGGYRFLEDIVLADAAFEATGETLEDLFESCARAVTSLMVDPSAIEDSVSKTISLHEKTIEALLYAWLADLVLIKDAEGLLFRSYRIEISGREPCELQAVLRGAPLASLQEDLLSDVKAVT